MNKIGHFSHTMQLCRHVLLLTGEHRLDLQSVCRSKTSHKIRSHIQAACPEGGSTCVAHWTGASLWAGVGSNTSCFSIENSAIYPFPSGHRAASARFATASQNSRSAKARSGIKGVKRSRRQAFPAKRSLGLQSRKPLKGVLGCKTVNP